MSNEPIHILLVDDDEDDYFITKSMLERIRDTQYKLEWCSQYEPALEKMLEDRFDVYLIDYRLGAENGLDLLEQALEGGVNSPIILLTGQGDREIDLAAMKAGASDYLVKGIIQAPLLERSIRYAIERKRTEEALKESEERYRDLFENANDMILSVDNDGHFNYVNQAWKDTLKYESSDLSDLTIYDIIHKDSRDKFEEVFAGCRKGESIDLVELIFVTKDGRNVYAQGSVNCKFVNGSMVSTRAIFRDVTQRKKAEWERNRLFETSRDLIGILNFKGHFHDLNPSWTQTLGYSEQEFKQINVLDLIYPEDREDAINVIKKIVYGHDSSIFELRLLSKDGSYKWLSCSITVEEKEQLIFASARDITEIKKSRVALLESEKRYRELIENSQGLIFTHDLNGKILSANQAFADTLGTTQGEIIEKSLNSFVISEADSDFQTYLKDIKAKPLVSGSLKLVKKKGDPLTIAYRNFRFKPQDNEEYVIGNAQDITDRVKAEEALLREQQQLQNIIENAPVPMALLDPDLQFITHSQKWIQEYTPRSSNDIIGRSYKEAYPWLPESWFEICTEGLKGKVLSKSEDEMTMLNGRKIHFRWAIHPWMDDTGSVQGIILVSDRIDELVNARLEAEKANNAKSAFLANITHELRTPLNAILGYSQILSKDNSLTGSQQEYISNMYRSGMHLLNMINDILDLSKIEAGKLDLNNDVVNLPEMLDEINGVFSLKSHDKGLNWTIVKDSALPDFIESDAAKLRQILINLVGNAIKFTDKGYVELKVVTENKDKEEGLVRLGFFVKDTGRGIPEDQILEIFEPFRQVKGRISEGTGLGLSITQRIVKLMNGTIDVKSEIDEGTLFHISIPFPLRENGNLETDNQFSKVSGITGSYTWKVLIIDDVDYNRSVLSVMLSRVGFECIDTPDGQRGPDLAEIMKPDIVFVDASLPDIDIREVTEKIRQTADNKNLVIIALTAMEIQNAKNELRGYGFNEFVRKPFSESDIFESIHKHTKVEYEYSDNKSDNKAVSEFSVLDAVRDIGKLEEPLKNKLIEALEMQDLDGIETISREMDKLQNMSDLTNRLRNAVLKSDYYFITLLNKNLEN